MDRFACLDYKILKSLKISTSTKNLQKCSKCYLLSIFGFSSVAIRFSLSYISYSQNQTPVLKILLVECTNNSLYFLCSCVVLRTGDTYFFDYLNKWKLHRRCLPKFLHSVHSCQIYPRIQTFSLSFTSVCRFTKYKSVNDLKLNDILVAFTQFTVCVKRCGWVHNGPVNALKKISISFRSSRVGRSQKLCATFL